eukprot:GHRR01019548.1.p1 GENE.GHRR01019548.1~~GHRR01019548.1.p1  ORF type:complete len:285 (+),score=76.66 GHRR01019548.1:229-1083(+)
MAAKSILNELYQRLRTAAPVYRTQGHEASEGFVCALTLPAVKSEWEVLLIDRSFQGYGSSKKEAEHAAANAAVDFLRNADVLRPDPPSATHSSKATSGATVSVATTSAGGVAAAYAAAPSPCCSSATSAVTAPGVGSKRSKSNTDLDEDSTGADSSCVLNAYCRMPFGLVPCMGCGSRLQPVVLSATARIHNEPIHTTRRSIQLQATAQVASCLLQHHLLQLTRAANVTALTLAPASVLVHAESLEWRILEALAGVYPRTLNGAQLAKLCGHFKLKSKVVCCAT